MDSRKRKLPSLGLTRRVRARADPEPEDFDDIISEDNVEDEESSSSEPDEHGVQNEKESEDEDSAEDDSQDDEASEVDESPQIDASAVSFGALARAQAAMAPSARKRKGAPDTDSDDASNGIVETWFKDKHGDKPRPKDASKTKSIGRTAKHAPAEMTSKKPVSRYREAVAVPKRHARDPRFDASIASASGSYAPATARLDEIKAEKAYAFLDGYRETEMAALREAIKGPKPAKGKKKRVLSEAEEREKERLKRALASMESRKKAKEAKEAERAVVEGHRRRERELVGQGKKPFYLKKAETKKRVLLDKFAGMTDAQAERAVARKRKKIAGKEKKSMPFARRGAE